MELPFGTGLIIGGLIAIIAIFIIAKGLMIVQQSESVVVERLGSFNRVLESGVNIIVPFIDKPRPITMTRYKRVDGQFIPQTKEETRIDRRETVMDFPGQAVVTTDNVTVQIDGVLYYTIVTPENVVYQVENMSQAVETLAKTTLRSVVGQMELDKLFASRSEVNADIQLAMEEPASKWGIKINRVELQDIQMPVEVEEAMRLQMAAERNRRATVTEAEGEKSAAIAKAQGQRESAILNAQGDKEAAVLRAEGERESIRLVLESLGDTQKNKETAVGYLLGQTYIKTLPDMAKQGERVFVPYESSALLGSMGMFREMAGNPSDQMAANAMKTGMLGGAGAQSTS